MKFKLMVDGEKKLFQNAVRFADQESKENSNIAIILLPKVESCVTALVIMKYNARD